MRKIRNALLRLVLLTSCLSVGAFAQDVTGTILGVVKDTTGGVLPGATIIAKDLRTNATHTVISDNEGTYSIRELPVGVYDINATLKGFKEFDAKGIQLDVNGVARVDLVLQVGNTSESVTVQANAIGVDTESSALKTVVSQTDIEELPLNGRDAAQLVRLVAGVELYRGTILLGPAAYPNTIPVTVNGGRATSTNYILDGGEDVDHYFNTPNPMPDPDALAEFNVQTTDFGAEYGRYAGGVVNAVTKSGSNQFHGSGFEFLRNNALNAVSFFAPPNPANPSEKENDGLKRNQFGGTVGGPIIRDKLFFFASYQRTPTRQRPVGSIATMPTMAERQGDFSALLPGTVLTDPFTGLVYPNNQIPSSEWNPATYYTMQNYMPSLPAGADQTYVSSVANLNDDQGLARADYHISAKNSLSGRFFIAEAVQPGFIDLKNFYDKTPTSDWTNKSVLVNDQNIFTPNLLNSFVFGYISSANSNLPPAIPPKSWCQLGAQMSCDSKYPQFSVKIGGLSSFASLAPSQFTRSEEEFRDTIHWTKGRNYIAFGGSYDHGAGDIVNDGKAAGFFTFADTAGFTGNAIADYLIGKFSNLNQAVGEFKDTRFNILSLFFDDSVKLSSRLKMELGLRWEPFFPYTDEFGKVTVWDPGHQSTRYPNAPPGELFAGDPGVPAGGANKRWLDFGPRVGLAWDVTGNGKTSLRAGFGIFFDRSSTLITNTLADQAPFGTTETVYGNALNSVANPWAGFPGGNPFTKVGFDAVGTTAINPPSNVAFALPVYPYLLDKGYRAGYQQAWNLTLEREIAHGLIAKISYAGEEGAHLSDARDINSAVYAPGATTSTTNQRRPLYPNYGELSLVESVSTTSYNSLQVTLEKRFSKRLSFLADYVWSKSLDGTVNSDPTNTWVNITDPFNQRYDRGPADFNHPQVLNISGVYDIPGRYSSKFANGLLGGWRLTTIVSLSSGPPFTVFDGYWLNTDFALSGQMFQRAQVIGNPILPGRSRGAQVAEYLNPQAFGDPAPGTYSPQGRNLFAGPGRACVDMGLGKTFPLGEHVTGHFRFEAFNAFNRVNLEIPDNDITDSTFNQILAPNSRLEFGEDNPRILQFALRFTF
jgi:hypothetical protein